ncbi:VPA1262 family N-terminal domain-containing protein [Sphingobacterium anhuiense]|uniref:VPA1262 family N-terminal domain-containing protein n=1 Tax=Sphingobacterium anhuiense TaxID=493780 RepID=A0ABW5YTZ3_9SPHI
MIHKLKPYYKSAIRTSLLAQDKCSKQWYHIFTVIELQTEDEYAYNIPNSDWKKGCIRAKQSKLEEYSFYLSIDEINSIDEAIDIFNNPINNFTIDENKISFINNSFIKEPSGNYPLVFTSNFYTEKGVASILPKRKSGLLVWCQIDNERKTDNKFISTSVTKEMSAMQELTMEWLGFDILQKREHIGNIYLSAPNPYFREVELSLSTDPMGVFYKILTRKNNFEPLKFRIIDKHGDAIALDKTFEIKKQADIIELPHEPHLFELRIYNQDDDLIAIHEPATFIRSIQFGMSIKQADFHVKVETDNGNKEFIVEKFSKEKPSVIGETKEFNPEYYFKNADKERQHIELAQRKEFIFYPGAKEEAEKTKLKENAKSIIREIINNANDTCYLCDPYFSSMDIVEFAFQIKNSGVKINILNSKEAVSKEEAKKIATVINEYNHKPFGKIEARILRGNSILHDRFIVTDKNVWFIGSSFNEFGNRATCIAKIPDSSGKLIIKEIEKWYNSDEFSQDIIEYTKELDNE